IDANGRVLATATAEYPLSRPHPGWSEQEPKDWWRAAQECLAQLPEGPIGLSGQMHGLVVLDGDGNVLRPAILWNDQRTAIEAADASGTVLFDVRRRAWSEEVCAALDIPLEWLPEAHESTQIAGAGDQAAAALGVGIAAPGPVSVVLGTSGVVFGALPAYAHDEQARMHVFCHAVPNTWHAMGVMLSAAGSAAWLRGVLGPGPAELDAEAERWEPGAEGLLFAPYLAGERTPHPDPDVRGAFTGLSARHDRGALWRAMLEGVAFGLRDSLELLRELGVRPESGRASGGGARSDLWLRIVASVLVLPI